MEDQLRMMDEKYDELRYKLDSTRSNSMKELTRVKSKAERLRMKWMAMQSFGSVPKELMDSAEGACAVCRRRRLFLCFFDCCRDVPALITLRCSGMHVSRWLAELRSTAGGIR